MPDYASVHKELQRSGVTLNLLWLEYCDQCRAAGEIPYQSTQFSKYYADYLAKINAIFLRVGAEALPARENIADISGRCLCYKEGG